MDGLGRVQVRGPVLVYTTGRIGSGWLLLGSVVVRRAAWGMEPHASGQDGIASVLQVIT